MKVQVTRKEFVELLVWHASRISGCEYPLKHSITQHVMMTLLCSGDGDPEDDVLFTIEVEHLPNVIPIGKATKSKGQDVR